MKKILIIPILLILFNIVINLNFDKYEVNKKNYTEGNKT